MATAFDYSQSAADALGLLKEFGQTLTLKQTTGGTYDPGTGATTGATTVSQDVVAVVLPANKGKFDDRLQALLVKGKVRSLIIAGTKADGTALDFVPTPLNLLTLDGSQWEIEGVTPLSPAGVPVMYNAIAIEGGQ